MAHGQRLLPVDVQGIEEFLGVALVAVDATVAAELFEGEASETHFVRDATSNGPEVMGCNRTSMDFWWIFGGFLVDLWWIFGGFLVDFSANFNNKHHQTPFLKMEEYGKYSNSLERKKRRFWGRL